MASKNTISVNINANVDTGKMRETILEYYKTQTKDKWVFDKDRYLIKDAYSDNLSWHPARPSPFGNYPSKGFYDIDVALTPYQELVQKAIRADEQIYYTICSAIGAVHNYEYNKILLPVFEILDYAKEYYYNQPYDLINQNTICAFSLKSDDFFEIEKELINDIPHATIYSKLVCEIDF